MLQFLDGERIPLAFSVVPSYSPTESTTVNSISSKFSASSSPVPPPLLSPVAADGEEVLPAAGVVESAADFLAGLSFAADDLVTLPVGVDGDLAGDLAGDLTGVVAGGLLAVVGELEGPETGGAEFITGAVMDGFCCSSRAAGLGAVLGDCFVSATGTAGDLLSTLAAAFFDFLDSFLAFFFDSDDLLSPPRLESSPESENECPPVKNITDRL